MSLCIGQERVATVAPLPILANVCSAEEVAAAVARGAEGIGLFRTEMLFMDREAPPSEDEQAAIYSAAVRAAEGRPVTLRTFDFGGDKPVPYLNLPVEKNPFLGNRGARLYPRWNDLLRTQLRAVFRAASIGKIRLMAPMITCPEEMRAFRAAVDEARADFPGTEVPVGMMIEVPAAACALEDFAAHADFFSIGTNDLAQYFLAADRDNPYVSTLYSAYHPSFLRLLRHVVELAHAHDRPVSLCGELAERPEALPLLLGLELDSISIAASRILTAKADLARLDSAAARDHLNALCEYSERVDVERALHNFRAAASSPPLLAAELIEVSSDSVNKHEVIKELADLLGVTERTADPAALEDAVWRREEAYSTGFGYGFAIPHCRSELVFSQLGRVGAPARTRGVGVARRPTRARRHPAGDARRGR